MNESEDIKKQLEVKNKEIYINKLSFDLNNNLEVLVLTIDNLLNSLKKEAIKKILEIEESFFNRENIQLKITNFIELYRQSMMDELDLKKSNLENIIVIHDDLEVCKTNLQDNYLSFKSKLDDFSNSHVKNLEESLKQEFDDKFKLKRLNEYLNKIFIVNLNQKILSIIKNRDLILMNTFNETYLKYLELNKNTVGV